MRRALPAMRSVAMRSAVPPTTRPRLPKVPTPWVTRSVSPWTTLDVVEAHPEGVGHHLREGRLLPLAVGRDARHHRDVAAGLDAHLGALPAAVPLQRRRAGTRAEPADLGEGRHADANEPAGGTGLLLGRAGGGIVEALHGLRQREAVVPAVVDGTGRCRVGEGVRREQVLAADLHRIHDEFFIATASTNRSTM